MGLLGFIFFIFGLVALRWVYPSSYVLGWIYASVCWLLWLVYSSSSSQSSFYEDSISTFWCLLFPISSFDYFYSSSWWSKSAWSSITSPILSCTFVGSIKLDSYGICWFWSKGKMFVWMPAWALTSGLTYYTGWVEEAAAFVPLSISEIFWLVWPFYPPI